MTTLWQRNCASIAITCLLLTAAQLRANPTDPTVIAGQASFSSQGSSLDITNTPGTVINWQGFSIGANQTTQFIQQNAASSVLNRVIGPDPSMLLGILTSNGRVFLINPSGIVVGEGARIDVAGLVASTLNLSNEDFAAGRLNFVADPFAGTVENHGTIVTPSGGSVYLVGSNVSNSGLINSPQGDVILAAGQSVRFFDSSTPGVRVEVTGSDNLAVNLGEILAKSGEVGIYAAAFRNAGIINADQVVRDASGRIVLRATQDLTLEADSHISANGEQAGEMIIQSETGTALVSGTIEARSTGAGQAGGTVHVLGDKVGLFGGHINATGAAGGGTVLVGGDYQGKNPDVQNATATFMSTDSTISADAITDGSGGRVILWANDSTRAHGSISARGGAQGGDGGLIETSAHWLDASGINIDAGAPHGKAGTWLLDPADVTITGAVTGGGSFSGGNPNVFTPASGLDTANVNLTTITTALNAGTDVTITTANSGTSGSGSGDISVDAVLTWSVIAPTTPTTLTLSAVRDVNVNSAITATRGSLVANAGRDVNVKAVITTTDGDVVLRADSDGTGPGVAGGTVAFLTGGGVTMTRGAASIYYNPTSYAAPTDYSSFFTLTDATLSSFMWVFAQGDNKVYDGLTDASLSFVVDPTVVDPTVDVTLTPGTANFDTKQAGTSKTITFSGFTLGGLDADEFALFFSDTPGSGTTTADITPAPVSFTGTKVYDTNTDFAFDTFGTAGTITTGVGTETLLLSGTGTVVSPNVSAGLQTVTLNTLALNDVVATGGLASNYTFTGGTQTGTITPATLMVTANPQSKIFGTADPALTFDISGLINNPALGIIDTADSVLSGALTRAPGESVFDGPYVITQGTLTSNNNYAIDFVGNLLVIIGAAEEPVLGFNAVQFLFAEVTNNVSYYRPGNFWHISLNPNNADPGFDVMRGTEELRSRANRCDSVSGAGYCETWSFPQQFGEVEDVE